jgi:hypothetical protein
MGMTKPDREIFRKLVATVVGGTRLSVVVGPSPVACDVLAKSGFKVFCLVAPKDFLRFCKACKHMLYIDVFPIIGDCLKATSALPVKVDVVFIDCVADFSIGEWMSVVHDGGLVAGTHYSAIRKAVSAVRPGFVRDIWWKEIPGSPTAKCAWKLMPADGANYLQTIATSIRSKMA